MIFSNRLWLKLFTIASFALLLASCFPGQAFAKDRSVIIGFHDKPGFSEELLVRGRKGKVKRKFRHIPAYAASLSDQSVEHLRKDARVKYVIDDTLYWAIGPVHEAGDPIEYENSWGVEHIGSWTAHDNNITGKGVRIAVLDTGIDYAHPELSMNFQGGWDFVFNDADPYDDSWNSHGTHVAGIIAAAANGSGVVGVAPRAELFAIKVLSGGGFGLLSWIIEGIEWAVDNNIDIVNISIAGPHTEALQDACDAAYEAGVLIVAAAGYRTDVAYPAAYDSVIAVTGTDMADQRGWFAPSGSQIELAAPGTSIQSTIVDDGYAELDGTSQAAPHVAGVAALILSAIAIDLNGDGFVDNQDVRLQLQMSALDLGDPGKDDVFGFGLVDIHSALGLDDSGDNPGLTIELLREPRHGNDRERATLSGLKYSVTISNDSLQHVRMAVYEHGKIRPDLSKMFRFTKKTGQETTFYLDAGGTSLHVVFSPIGRPGSSAMITINYE